MLQSKRIGLSSETVEPTARWLPRNVSVDARWLIPEARQQYHETNIVKIDLPLDILPCRPRVEQLSSARHKVHRRVTHALRRRCHEKGNESKCSTRTRLFSHISDVVSLDHAEKQVDCELSGRDKFCSSQSLCGVPVVVWLLLIMWQQDIELRKDGCNKDPPGYSAPNLVELKRKKLKRTGRKSIPTVAMSPGK
eukprot:scaffold2717_cov89-Cylindrotheca_fusiformis.AAC.2